MSHTPDIDRQITPQNPSGRKVMVGLSGGVDSSVSAMLLKQQGYDVEAIFMKNWADDDGTEYCTAQQDLEDALRIADQLDIELHTANFVKDYWDNVFTYFLQEYQNGRTPNPDVLCNREIKFKVFFEYANSLGADLIATGHYANIVHNEQQAELHKGLDQNKDQSYFLHAVDGSQFARTLFPLGNIEKAEVREMAQKAKLITHNKKDSTGICFIGERRFKDFLQRYLPAQPGNIVDSNMQSIGEHHGLMYHTIGQRQGLGIGGKQQADDKPWYVAAKNLDDNTLMVVQGNNHPLLFSQSAIVSDVHWINSAPATDEWRCHAKARYRQADQACQVQMQNDGDLRVTFDDAQRAITPGQYLVLYQGSRCLGGGVIQQAI